MLGINWLRSRMRGPLRLGLTLRRRSCVGLAELEAE